MREGHGFHGAGFAVPNRRLLPLAALSFVLMATEGAGGDWSGTYLARSGVDPRTTAAAYAAFSLLMITGRIVGDGIVGAAGSRATVALGALIAGAGLAISAAWPGLVGEAAHRLRTGWRRSPPMSCLFSSASPGGSGSSPAVGVASRRDCGLCRPAHRAGRHWRYRVGCWSALDDHHAGRTGAPCGGVRLVEGEEALCADGERGSDRVAASPTGAGQGDLRPGKNSIRLGRVRPFAAVRGRSTNGRYAALECRRRREY